MKTSFSNIKYTGILKVVFLFETEALLGVIKDYLHTKNFTDKLFPCYLRYTLT